ncbi:MAG: hypothetical protein AAF670_02120, partial [Planctomycetota bacterium]
SIREIMTGHLTSSLIICGKTIGRLPDVLFKSNSDYQTVPSKTADKAAQIAKEARIRANGGTFIRDKFTRELIDVSNVPTRVTRRK